MQKIITIMKLNYIQLATLMVVVKFIMMGLMITGLDFAFAVLEH